MTAVQTGVGDWRLRRLCVTGGLRGPVKDGHAPPVGKTVVAPRLLMKFSAA